MGLLGYALLILELCGIGKFLRAAVAPTASFMLLWYGLYFGVLGRDCAEVAADRMVSRCALSPCIISSTARRWVSFGVEFRLCGCSSPFSLCVVSRFRRSP